METLGTAYCERILANVARLVELDNTDVSLLLKRCSLRLNRGPGQWQVTILWASDVYKILQTDGPVGDSIKNPVYRSLKDVALGEGIDHVEVKFSSLVEENYSDWRHELPADIVSQLQKEMELPADEEEDAPELTCFGILSSQQKDFIQRLEKSSDCLLRCDEVNLFSELIAISNQRTLELQSFCWDMTRKFNYSDPESIFTNTLKGKLGEESLFRILRNCLTDVDYGVKPGGDGKIDFRLKSCPEIRIQVKARNGKPSQVKWSVSQAEIEANDVVVCFVIQEKVTTTQPEYHIISAGFIPTNEIVYLSDLSINDLYYLGGLRSYLEFLAQQEQFRQKTVAKLADKVIRPLQARSQLVSISAKSNLDLEQIWQEILCILQPPGTQALFKQQGCLLSLEGSVARIGITSQPLFKMAQQRVGNIEVAFAKYTNYPVKVSLEVVVAPIASAPVAPIASDNSKEGNDF